MPQYPQDSPTLTVSAMLKQPALIARALSDIVFQRYVADQIFARGTPDQVLGGAARYQRSESIFPDRDVEELALGSEYPRAGWSEAVLTAAVKKYGLEIPITDEAARRNQMDQMQRGLIKLANAMVKFVDTKAMAMLLADAAVLTAAASGDWTTAATDILSDLAVAKTSITNVNEGYEANVLVVNPAQELDLLKDADMRSVMPRETGASTVQTGRLLPMMGLDQVIVTPNLTAGTVLVGQAKMIGTIADEAPAGSEGYSTFSAGAGVAPTFVKVYREDNADRSIVRAVRWPAMWIAEPKSFYKITGA